MSFWVHQLLFASVGVTLLASVGWLLRSWVRFDVVYQYRMQAAVMMLTALLLPLQATVCSFVHSGIDDAIVPQRLPIDVAHADTKRLTLIETELTALDVQESAVHPQPFAIVSDATASSAASRGQRPEKPIAQVFTDS